MKECSKLLKKTVVSLNNTSKVYWLL